MCTQVQVPGVLSPINSQRFHVVVVFTWDKQTDKIMIENYIVHGFSAYCIHDIFSCYCLFFFLSVIRCDYGFTVSKVDLNWV